LEQRMGSVSAHGHEHLVTHRAGARDLSAVGHAGPCRFGSSGRATIAIHELQLWKFVNFVTEQYFDAPPPKSWRTR